MEIINGQEVLREAFLLDPTIEYDSITKTDSYTITWADTGRTIVFNSSDNKIGTLPTGNAAYIGRRVHVRNVNSGRLTLQAAANDYVDDSSKNGTIYCDDDTVAGLILELVTATRWHIVAANGTWTTT